jgi:hypothetical protein
MKNKQQLNGSNVDCIIWQYEQLQFTLLSGIAIEGLDRMRAEFTDTLLVRFRQSR